MPNITGTVKTANENNEQLNTGAFAVVDFAPSGVSGGSFGRTVDFNASRCSSIYRDDITTVQPNALTSRFYIKY